MLRDEGEAYAAALRDAHDPAPGWCARAEASVRAIDEVAAFLRTALARDAR